MKYKKIVIVEPFRIEIAEESIGEAGQDEVLIKIKKVALCGSDLHLYAGSYKGPHSYPIVPGHEWIGEILETGSGVKDFNSGDRVTGDASLWCGACKCCSKDKNLCVNIDKRGLTKDGAAAQYIITKAKYLYKVPASVPDELGCLTEAFAVAWHALKQAEEINTLPLNRQRILVLGAGPIGLAAAMILKKAYLCSEVFIKDLVEFRVAMAESMGINRFTSGETINTENESYYSMYSKPGFDLIIESTGVNSVLEEAVQLVEPKGTILTLAPIRNFSISGGLHCLKSVRIVGSIGGTGNFMDVIGLFDSDPEYFSRIITHRFEFGHFEKALLAQKELEERMVIVVDGCIG